MNTSFPLGTGAAGSIFDNSAAATNTIFGTVPAVDSRPSAPRPPAGVIPGQRVPSDAVDVESLTHIRAMVADPDVGSRESLSRTLLASGIGSVENTGDAAAAAELLAAAPGGDLLLVSLGFGAAASALVVAAKAAGWVRVIALAPVAEIGPVIDAVGAGAHGVLIGRRANPAASNLPSTIHDLSAREIEVLRLVADGRSNKWIGESLSLSALTVKSHLARIGRKLGTGDRAHMVALALRAGVIS